MLKRMLATGMLGVSLMVPISAFAQEQSGQTMQSENKMGDTMKKDGDKMMMKGHKTSKHKSRKNKAHRKSTKMKNSM